MELIPEIASLRLDPLQHRDGVQMFRDYFRLQPQEANRRFLENILERFATLPYENISKIIKLHDNWSGLEKLRLPEQVMADHISQRLGGTCFSLTFLLQAILAQHGFLGYAVMADMRAGRNIHCAMIVMLDRIKYLVDPGYLLTQPMELNPQKPRLYRSEFAGVELRYDTSSQTYDLLTFNQHETKWRYRFADRPTSPQEFLQHWLASFGWNS
ncbi:MAG TPA: arylamine N-acetyltransferase, partial [bacterium]